ncbi:DUF4136 domain-containing protein [Aliikangiella sp. IMCC44653]
MLQTIKFGILLVGVLSVLVGCASKPPVTYDYDVNYNFSQLKKYAWVKSEQAEKVLTLDQKRQINAIETILNRKGFSKAATVQQADFLLKTHVVTDKKVDVDRFYSTWGYHPYIYPNTMHPGFIGWPRNSTTVVTERKISTLVLDIVDPKKQQVIWRGSVASPLGIYNNRTPEERMTIELNNASEMLSAFPPR